MKSLKNMFKHLAQPCRQKGERGFTLIELLIVIAVLGVLAAVAVPNVSGFIVSGTVAAANSELAALNTAQQGYAAEHSGTFAAADTDLAAYLTGAIKAAYDFSTTTGAVTQVDSVASGWSGVVYDISDKQWVRGADVAGGGTQDKP